MQLIGVKGELLFTQLGSEIKFSTLLVIIESLLEYLNEIDLLGFSYPSFLSNPKKCHVLMSADASSTSVHQRPS